ncbi:hypothetical protein FQR65_LT09334 [Abscondita terminalis]|nr:hypothetical protein FQR65_LT09334 [Abscondita terminalis]
MLRLLILLLSVTFCASDPSVIIIGAGPSGIAAATRLLKNGVTNLVVLEAENRIGGRVFSVPFGKDYIDLGAEWCHGVENNIVYDMIKDLDILRPRKYILPKISHSKDKILEQSFSKNLSTILEELVEGSHEADGSLGEVLIKNYEEKISWWKNNPKYYAVAKDAVELLETYVNSLEGSFSWFDVSASSDYDGEDSTNLNWNGLGYKTILEFMMQKYPDPSKALPIDDKILLNKEVEHISWDSDKVVVKCADGSSYTADHVIVTVSLGVLKHQHNSLFSPKLPADNFVWDNEDKDEYKEGPTKDGKSWTTSMAIITGIQHNPNVLSAWVTGPFVPDVEKCSDETVIDGVMHLLEYFNVAEGRTITRPDKIIRAKWYTNPHFRGTYSFQTINTRRGVNSDETILAAPLGDNPKKPNLLFAGEATNPIHFSTVHGAIESGFREADRIIGMYK